MFAAPAADASDGLDAHDQAKLANLQAALGDAYREVGRARRGDRRPTARRSTAARASTTSATGSASRCASTGLPDQAIREFGRVLRANPAYLDASVQLGVTYYTLGRAAEARDEWNATLERDPSRDDARMYLRLLEHPRPDPEL